METDFLPFHIEDEQFSTNSFLSNGESGIKEQLELLSELGFGPVKSEPNVGWSLGDLSQALLGTDEQDLSGIMSLWQQTMELPLMTESGMDVPPTQSYLDTRPSPILTKALTSFDDRLRSSPPAESPRGVGSSLLRKVTLLTGEKEILGKNIVGLQCLKELEEDPQENCQMTSAIINGKRYKIIIRPKSQKGSTNTEQMQRSLLRKLTQGSLLKKDVFTPHVPTEKIKLEPPEDETTSEMLNGVYELPEFSLGTDDLSQTWNFETDKYELDEEEQETTCPAPVPKVPPLRIKIPKSKKYRKKKKEEEIDVVGGGLAASDLKSLLETFEETTSTDKSKNNEGIKCELPKEMVDRLEASRRKKDGRIGLMQAVPRKKTVNSGTRMQEAAVAMNRNKLLKIVSSGDAVQLDHDYCTTTSNSTATSTHTPLSLPAPHPKTKARETLVEKNPKKDSGLESGDVSDASEEHEPPQACQESRSMNAKILEQRRRSKNHGSVTRAAAEYFRQANATVHTTTNTSDELKTVKVYNGCKVKTNVESECADSVAASTATAAAAAAAAAAAVGTGVKAEVSSTAVERPKKKLKLEEYLSRRNEKVKQEGSQASTPEAEEPEQQSAHCVTVKSKVVIIEETPVQTRLKKKEDEEVETKVLAKPQRCVKVEEEEEKKSSSRSRSSSVSRRASSSTRKVRSSSRTRRLWSRSRSRSSRSCSSSERSYRKRTKSPPRHRRRSPSWSRDRSRNRNYVKRRHNYHRRSRSPYVRERQRQVEERRVVYVGRVDEGITNSMLRDRFSVFGPVVDISLHFREHGDNYGFVTFAYKCDAYDAVEHGNDDPDLPRYDLCFGGRRGFCKQRYADLDEMPTSYSSLKDAPSQQSQESFDALLQEAQAKLRRRRESK